MADVKTLIDLIGNTPMVQVKNMDTGPCNLYLKMEGMNPGASIKDRVALNIIETAERDGLLKPGYTIIEASAGNTAMGLALIGKLKGYKSKVVILDKMNNNKMKFNGKSDNRNNRTATFNMQKADLDKDGKISSYEKTRGMAIQKAMKGKS